MLQTKNAGKRFLNYLYPVIMLSYLFPILRRRASEGNETLELFLYRNQYQLGTHDALYSDGTRYKPMTIAFAHLGKEKLHQLEDVLVLGTGLASAAHILHHKGYTPAYTLVERNKTILQWALELMPASIASKVTPRLSDANDFIQNEDRQYDLLIVDVFNGRVVPPFVTTTAFLEKCRFAIKAERHFVMNYMINNEVEWQEAIKQVTAVFPTCKVLDNGINRIVVATV